MNRLASPHLENLRTLLWVFFWILTALAAVLWPLGLGETQLHERIANPDLRAALSVCLRWLDVAWITLAAINLYLALAAQEGLPTARRWALTLGVGSSALIALGAKTGWPFGPITYTGQLGPRLLGLVPAALPMLWFVIVAASRLALRRFAPNALALALGVGFLTMLSAFCLELIAAPIRAYWLWDVIPGTAHHAAQNLAAWFIAGALLGSLLRERSVVARRSNARPLAILLAVNGVFLVTWLGWQIFTNR